LGQQHSNNFIERKTAEDGIPGDDTRKQGIACVQHAMNLDYGVGIPVDGEWGSLSDNAFGGHYVCKGETQFMVTALEILFLLNDVDQGGVECPGVFGSGLGNTTEAWESSHGLTVDRSAGREVFGSLMGVVIGSYAMDTSGATGSMIGLDWQGYDPSNLPNFDQSEFVCYDGCGGDVCDDLKVVAQIMRDHFGPVTISPGGGARCPSVNAAEGGVPDSLHVPSNNDCIKSIAMDVFVSPMSHGKVDEIAEFVQSINPNIGTIRYRENLFVHIQIGYRDQSDLELNFKTAIPPLASAGGIFCVKKALGN
ncbi:D-Ala-D-Ala carboxypeptidase family metallohydrolase, partial [Eubacterium aggregans]|uniref:D-Ala-D-Ala carboxypeptidase family metallohydrolase n=1 Tax=Eubacterium aggregans TaxID=81409 RepID=UPI003F31B8B8